MSHISKSSTPAIAVRDWRRQQLLMTVAMFTILVLMSFCSMSAWGQRPKYDIVELKPAYEVEKNVRLFKAAAKALSSHSGDLSSFKNRRAAEAYFKVYVPAKLTHPDAVKEISELTQDSLSYLNKAQRMNSPVAPSILGWLGRGMKAVAEGNYQPAGRINAILALGRMDRSGPDPAKQLPAVPFVEAIPILLKLYQNEKNVDGVRAAALQGIRRHCVYGFPYVKGASREAVLKEMAALLTSTPPAGRSADAHAYLQSYAIDVLNALEPENAQFGVQLVSLSTSPDQPDLVAFHSAAAIGSMGKALEGKVKKSDELLELWTARAMRSFQLEQRRLQELDERVRRASQPPSPESVALKLANQGKEKKSKSSPRSGLGGGLKSVGGDGGSSSRSFSPVEASRPSGLSMGGGGMGGSRGKRGDFRLQPPEVLVSRGKLNYQLQQLQLGVTGSSTAGMPSTPGGVLAAVPGDEGEIKRWTKKIEDVLEGLNDRSHDTRARYVAMLQEQVDALRELAGDAAEEMELPDPNDEHLARLDGEDASTNSDQPIGPVIDSSGAPEVPTIDELAP